MEKRYETRSGDLFVRSWARVRRVSLDRRSSAGETDGVSVCCIFFININFCNIYVLFIDSHYIVMQEKLLSFILHIKS